MLVDESGSMSHLAEATCAGFNEYVSTLRHNLKADRSYFSAITFDSRGIRKLQIGSPINQAIELSSVNYQPCGGTPLLDAIGQTIAATDEVAGKHKASKIIVVIQTDGYENASSAFTLADIKSMIEERQGNGWEFVFIGAGIDAFSDATQLGIIASNTMSYQANEQSTRAVFGATAQNTAMFAQGIAGSMGYSVAQSKTIGESDKILKAKLQAVHGLK
jgi:uncharacterized protein with von Willebrand factor type A (vWA) domain